MIALIHDPAAIEAAQRLRHAIKARTHEIALPEERADPELVEAGYLSHPRETGKARVYTACLSLNLGFTSEDVAAISGLDRKVTSHYLVLLQRAGLVLHTESRNLSPMGGKPTKFYRVRG